MRVAHVLTSPMSLLFLRGQLAFMQDAGVEMHVLVAPGAAPVTLPAGVVRHDIPIAREISPLSDVRALWAISRLLGRLRPDIVHCQTPKAGLLGTLAAAWRRVPARIYHVRGLRFHGESGWRRRLLHATERLACGLATSVQSHSASLTNAILEDRLTTSDKIVQLANGGNGVDVDFYASSAVAPSQLEGLRARLGLVSDAPLVLYVGRLHRDKGVMDLLDAWSSVRSRIGNARLLLVGPNELDDAGITRAREASSLGVSLVGEQSDTRPFYALADLVVLPTYREGLPNVLLEAAAMERCVVATRTTGCVDVVEDGTTGCLVPVRNPAALADSIVACLSDRAALVARGVAARRSVTERFDQNRIWTAQLAQYRRLAPTA